MASSTSNPAVRPSTSKSRGVCRYYETPRGCFAGDKCKFLHGVPEERIVGGVGAENNFTQPLLTPYDKSKRCRYFDRGFCKRGENCWFLHKVDGKDEQKEVVEEEEEEEELCSICFEKPSTYGLLSGCSHTFCIKCIKQWRDPQSKGPDVVQSGNNKKCPMCRASSSFITPSSKFWKEGTDEKVKITQAYKDSMARVPCKYFQKSIQKNKHLPICPYGKDCFYQHLNDDGTPYLFEYGVDIMMPRFRRMNSTHRRGSEFDLWVPFGFSFNTPLDYLRPDFATRAGRVDLAAHNADQLASGSRRSREANVAYAAQRLREVGRSLEMLNEVITDGASLENMNYAVEALRVGLGRLEGNVDGIQHPPRFTRRTSEGDDGSGTGLPTVGDENDAVRQRLEALAEQMLDSINALRDGGTPNRVETPPPPLIAEDASSGDDDDGMPSLGTVSRSGSEYSSDDGDGEEDDDSDSDDDLDFLAAEFEGQIAMDMVRGVIDSWTTPANNPSRSLLERLDPSSSARFSTVVNREEPTAADDDSDDELPPPLEAIDSHEETPSPTADLRKVGESSAFTTDGRGRVISVGERTEETESATSTTTTSSDNAVEDNPASGGLFSWIGSIF